MKMSLFRVLLPTVAILALGVAFPSVARGHRGQSTQPDEATEEIKELVARVTSAVAAGDVGAKVHFVYDAPSHEKCVDKMLAAKRSEGAMLKEVLSALASAERERLRGDIASRDTARRRMIEAGVVVVTGQTATLTASSGTAKTGTFQLMKKDGAWKINASKSYGMKDEATVASQIESYEVRRRAQDAVAEMYRTKKETDPQKFNQLLEEETARLAGKKPGGALVGETDEDIPRVQKLAAEVMFEVNEGKADAKSRMVFTEPSHEKCIDARLAAMRSTWVLSQAVADASERGAKIHDRMRQKQEVGKREYETAAVVVSGDSATLTIRPGARSSKSYFVKKDGVWKLDASKSFELTDEKAVASQLAQMEQMRAAYEEVAALYRSGKETDADEMQRLLERAMLRKDAEK